MRHRRIITLILAGLLAGATAVPALAEDKPTGLDRARQATQRALELVADDADEASPAIPPGQAKEDSGKGPGAKGKAGKATPHEADVKKVTGRARAAAAIASAIARGNGNGFGRDHALEVIGLVLDGKTPDALETHDSHGAEMSAMVKAYNELKARERADD